MFGERKGIMKRMLAVVSIFVAAAFVGVSAAGAVPAPTTATFCVAGVTTTVPIDSIDNEFYSSVVPDGGYFIDESVDVEEGEPAAPAGDEPPWFDDDLLFVDEVDSSVGLTFFSVSAGPCAPATPPQVDNVFLCYSTFSNVPAVFPAPVAAALLKAGGYWTPYAVPGSADGGTNIGGYHLVCNLASGQAAGDNTLGGAGEVDGANTKPDVSNTAGYYPIIGG